MKKSQEKQDPKIVEFKAEISKSIILAFERLETQPVRIEIITEDVYNEFKNIGLKNIQKAIRNGSLGMYGRTFKLTTQEICFWIYEFINRESIVVPNSSTNQRLNTYDE